MLTSFRPVGTMPSRLIPDSILPIFWRWVAMDDEGDFKKARGFLLTYSSLLLAMWFFKAELTKFNLMGVSLTLEHHKESIWLVLALLNAYFWFRCWQRMPHNALYFDERMHDLYDRALIWFGCKWKRRELRRLAQQQFAARNTPSEQMQITWYSGHATARESLAEDQRYNGDEAPELHQVNRTYRTKLIMQVGYSFTENGKWIPYPLSASFPYQPSAVITWLAKAFAILKGAFVTPWFTDHVAPLLLGGISTSVALWKWVEVNFLTVG
jgi:hypothetical protein